MASKTVIAIVAAIIIIAGGVATYILLSGPGDTPEKKTDVLRTNLEIGDYTEVSMEISASSESTMQESENLYLYALYPDINSYYIEKGQKTITYKGQELTCTIFSMDGFNMGYYMCNGVCYGNYYGSEDPMETLLIDTSFDLSKTKEQQTLKQGEFYKMKTNMMGTLMISQSTVGTFDETTGEWNIIVKMSTDAPITQTEKQTVMAIGDKLTVESTVSGTDTVTKADFLSVISYSNMIDYFKEAGYKYEIGKKTSETISTIYGDRNVDVQAMTYVDSDVEYKVSAYCCGDVIYQLQVESSGTTIISKLTATSLITPAN